MIKKKKKSKLTANDFKPFLYSCQTWNRETKYAFPFLSFMTACEPAEAGFGLFYAE